MCLIEYTETLYLVFSNLGALGKAPEVVEDSLPVPAGAAASVSLEDSEEEEGEENMEHMRARLEALRS